MNRNHRSPFGPVACLVLIFAIGAGCGDDHARSIPLEHGHGHSHVAPHGGQVIILGNEAFHLELLHDRNAGRLTVYVLDGHMENFIRLPAPALKATCTVQGADHPLVLNAVAQAATGETVGDSSQFSGEADWLKSPGVLAGSLETVEIRGQVFAHVRFELPN